MQASPSLLAPIHPSRRWPVVRSTPWRWARPSHSARLLGKPSVWGSSKWASTKKLFYFSFLIVWNESVFNVGFSYREETEIIEGEVVEIQIDRPATGTVGTQSLLSHAVVLYATTRYLTCSKTVGHERWTYTYFIFLRVPKWASLL